MDFTWIVYLVIAGFFTYKGYRQGILVTVSRVASFVAGYIASVLFGAAVASFLEKTTSLNGIAAFIVSRVGVFVLVSILVGLVFSAIVKKIQKQRGKEISTASALGGAGLGLAVGSAIAFFMIFFVSFAQDLIQPKINNSVETSSQASAAESNQTKKPKNIVEKVSRKIASKVVEIVGESSDMDPAAAKVAGAFINNPKVIMEDIQTVINSTSTKKLFNDPSNQTILNTNDPAAIANLPDFKDMINNPKMKELAEASGFDSVEGEAFNQELAEQIGKMWSRAQEVKNDTRVQEIMSDPNFREKIKSNNPMALIADPNFMEIVKILTSKDFSADNSSPIFVNGNPEQSEGFGASEANVEEQLKKQEKKEPVIHKWVDEDGHVHYSDTEPK